LFFNSPFLPFVFAFPLFWPLDFVIPYFNFNFAFNIFLCNYLFLFMVLSSKSFLAFFIKSATYLQPFFWYFSFVLFDPRILFL